MKTFSKFLKSSHRELIRFLVQQWKTQDYSYQLGSQFFMCHVTSGPNICGQVLEEQSDHEDVDTCILPHAKHATSGLSVKNECVIWYWIAQIVCAIGSGTRSVPPRP